MAGDRRYCMFSGIYWGIGSRTSNEDSLALEQVSTDKGTAALAVVCDGIGTLEHGEIVSGYVTEMCVKWFYRVGVFMSGASASRIRRSISKCVYDCHTELKKRAAGSDIVWGCTFTLICIWNGRFVCAHLGDSSAMILTDRGVRHITQLHRNERGQLTRCVGSMGYYKPEFSFGRLKKKQGILVASDGFTEKLTDTEISGMLAIHSEISDEMIEKRLVKIGAETERRGGGDNRSAVCIFRR